MFFNIYSLINRSTFKITTAVPLSEIYRYCDVEDHLNISHNMEACNWGLGRREGVQIDLWNVWLSLPLPLLHFWVGGGVKKWKKWWPWKHTTKRNKKSVIGFIATFVYLAPVLLNNEQPVMQTWRESIFRAVRDQTRKFSKNINKLDN